MKNVAVLAIIVTCICSMSAQATTQKPVRVQELDVMTSPPPDSDTEMVLEADGVVLVEYVGRSRLLERRVPGLDEPDLSTEYTFRVKELLKWHPELPPVGSDFLIAMPGGEKEEPTQIRRIKVMDADPLIPHREYVLFVSWNSKTNVPFFPWGAASIYDISGGTVQALAHHATRHNGRPTDRFLAALRRGSK